MSQQILQVDQAMLETTLDRMVRKSVEETLNAMLDAEADEITGAARYERGGQERQTVSGDRCRRGDARWRRRCERDRHGGRWECLHDTIADHR